MIEYDNACEPMKRNDALLGVFRANLAALGAVESPEVRDRLGSSELGT